MRTELWDSASYTAIAEKDGHALECEPMPGEKSSAQPDGAAPRPASRHRGAFTRYVRQLEPGREPSPESFEELWRALRGAVVHELQRRGLWSASPAYLGVYGWRSWHEAAAGTSDPTGPLEELLVDCYSFVFLSRLSRLKAHLRSKDNIEGLAFRSIRNFLHNRQRRNDPLGIQTFELLRCALGGLIDAGELVAVEGDLKVRNATLLAATPLLATAAPAGDEELASVVAPWADDLLPGLLAACRRERQRLVELLQDHVRELLGAGFGAFRVRQLAEPLKSSVRARWAALLDFETGEAGFEERGDLVALVGLVRPTVDERLAAEEHFAHLVRCVERRIERSEEAETTRRYLATLWRFLQVFAVDEEVNDPAGGPAGEGDSGDRLPSNRQLGALLGIPRERLPGLFATLGSAIKRCKATLSSRLAGVR